MNGVRGYADGAGQKSVISPIYINKGQKDKWKLKNSPVPTKTQNPETVSFTQYFLILPLLFTRNLICILYP